MTTIGRLKPSNVNDPMHFLEGNISTSIFSGKIEIQRLAESDNEKAPTHRVFMVAENGDRIEIGAAWEKTTKRGEQAGQPFLSVSVDDPAWPKALSFSVFKDTENEYVAVWRRRREVQPI